MDFMQKLKNIMPKNVQPIFTNYEEYKAFRDQESQKYAADLLQENEKRKLQSLLGNSGIPKRLKNCTLSGFEFHGSEQEQAFQKKTVQRIRAYIAENSTENFIFSGGTGTGKNHLAACMVKSKINQRKSASIITLVDFEIRLRDCYKPNSALNEKAFIDAISNLDLLIFDEIGIQNRNAQTAISIFNYIVDQRTANSKTTGFLTNLNKPELIDSVGERIFDRMRMKGFWLTFNWQSFREKVK